MRTRRLRLQLHENEITAAQLIYNLIFIQIFCLISMCSQWEQTAAQHDEKNISQDKDDVQKPRGTSFRQHYHVENMVLLLQHMKTLFIIEFDFIIEVIEASLFKFYDDFHTLTLEYGVKAKCNISWFALKSLQM